MPRPSTRDTQPTSRARFPSPDGSRRRNARSTSSCATRRQPPSGTRAPECRRRQRRIPSLDVRARGLARLGLIDSVNASLDPPWHVDCARNPPACRQSVLWTIHGLGHGLGLAVHDPAGYYYGDRTFRVGRRVHHRARHLHLERITRRASRHAEESRIHRSRSTLQSRSTRTRASASRTTTSSHRVDSSG